MQQLVLLSDLTVCVRGRVFEHVEPLSVSILFLRDKQKLIIIFLPLLAVCLFNRRRNALGCVVVIEENVTWVS